MEHQNLILLIETATAACSVALAQGGDIIAYKERTERNIHASHITLFIDEVMQIAQKSYTDLDAVAISKGPGSYTGLRIGTSTAKGLCFGLDIPLIAINTLEAMATGILTDSTIAHEDSIILCPMIDARRMEVYTAMFNQNMIEVEATQAKIIGETSYENYLITHQLVFFGDGAKKLKPLYKDKKNVIFVPFENKAAHLAILAEHRLKSGIIEDVAYFEPFYLKDFISTKPKQR